MWYMNHEGEPVIHVTEVGSMLACPYLWAQRRRGEFSDLTSAPMVRGKAAHKARRRAIEAWLGLERDDDNNVIEMLEPGRFPTYQELVEIGREEVAKHCTDEGQVVGNDGVAVEGTDILAEAALYIEFDLKSVLPQFVATVEKPEHRLTIPLKIPGLKHDWHLTGQIDALCRDTASRRLVNRDMKTGAFKQQTADRSDQPTGYSMLIAAEYGERPLHVFDTARFLKSAPRKTGPGAIVEELDNGLIAVSETVSTDRNRQDMEGFGRKIAFVLSMIENEIFPPAGTGFMSPCERCEYHVECEFCSSAGGHC